MFRKNNAANNAVLLGITEKTTELHVGNIRISAISRLHGRAEMGLLLGEKALLGSRLRSGSDCERNERRIRDAENP